VGAVAVLNDEVIAFLSAGTRTGMLGFVAVDGRPLVAPIWFVVDGDDLVFNTGADTAKARAISRDPRVAVCVDDPQPPYSFVQIQGVAALSDELEEVRTVATRAGGRYMGAERADEYGRRNGVLGELVVRVTPTKVITGFNLTE
jgi:PPOX class probable F420-dependent enzyme